MLSKRKNQLCEVDHDMFKSGPVGMVEITKGAFNNIVVAENINGIVTASTPVSSQGKLH